MSAPHPHRTRPGAGALVALLGLLSACGSDDRADDPPPVNDVENTSPASNGTLLASDEGTGTVWIDGTEHGDFAGSCELSRRNGREEMGELANREGIVVSVAIDNVASTPPVEMKFVALNDSTFRMSSPAGRIRGLIRTIAYESELTPKGTSQAMARVSFTGATVEDVPVVAHVVCEIQNKF